MSKRVNQDSEPSKKVLINLRPEDRRLADELKIETHQTGKGYTGIFRWLLLDAARRLGWPSPYAAEKPATEAQRHGEGQP